MSKFELFVFIIYTLVYETFVLGGTAYIVFGLGHSGCWWILGIILSSAQLKPHHFNKELYLEHLKDKADERRMM